MEEVLQLLKNNHVGVSTWIVVNLKCEFRSDCQELVQMYLKNILKSISQIPKKSTIISFKAITDIHRPRRGVLRKRISFSAANLGTGMILKP
jgi:hypothetical protein